MRFFVTTPFSMERPVKLQLERMELSGIEVGEGRVYFSGSVDDLAAVLVNVRVGDRVYWEVASFKALTFDELFEGVNKLDWANIIDANGKINVSAKCARSRLMSVPDTQRITKMAIVKSMLRRIRKDRLPETGNVYPVDVHLHKDIVTVALDCCGAGLHKRGYRVKNAVAPLRETFAAGLIDTVGYRGQCPFVDTFCGSGTIAIEAAMHALNIAPCAEREFIAEGFKGFDKKAFDRARANARASVKDIPINIYASDISPEMVDMSRYHARRAGVEDYISFSVSSAGDMLPALEKGIMLTNPPYGERIGDERYMIELCSEIGIMLKNYSSYNRYVLSGYKMLEKHCHVKADKVRRYYNGNIECNLFGFSFERDLNT